MGKYLCEFDECRKKQRFVQTDNQLKAIGLMRKHYDKYHPELDPDQLSREEDENHSRRL